MSLFQFYSYIDGSLQVSGLKTHLQESSHSCSHNHWFRIWQYTEHATWTVQILNQWLCEQLCELSWRWACRPETCRDPSIYEWNWNSDICWFFISYAEKMHGTKTLKFVTKLATATHKLWSNLIFLVIQQQINVHSPREAVGVGPGPMEQSKMIILLCATSYQGIYIYIWQMIHIPHLSVTYEKRQILRSHQTDIQTLVTQYPLMYFSLPIFPSAGAKK